MGTFLLLCALGVAALLAVSVVASIIGFLFKAVFWVVTLPFRIVFKVLFGLAGLLFSILLAPVMLVIAVIGGVVALVTTVLPMLPMLLLGIFGWTVYRLGWKKPGTPPPLPPQSFWH
jgi:hypothetical protein